MAVKSRICQWLRLSQCGQRYCRGSNEVVESNPRRARATGGACVLDRV
jgi:hypothetical protein